MRKAMKWLVTVLAVLMLSCAFVLTGCGRQASVVSIERAESRGSDEVFTVTYSDGSTTELVISGGEDGQDVTAEDLWQTYIEKTGDDIEYEEFLEKYLTIESGDNSAVIGKTLLSSMKVYTEFVEQTIVSGGFGQISRQEGVYIYTGGAVIYSMGEEYSYILTNYHVVYNADASGGNADGNKNGDKIARRITCYLYGSEGEPSSTNSRDDYGYTLYDYGDYAIDCEYVGGSVAADIAVLRAETQDILAVNEDACAVALADGYEVGDTAYTIGNPENEGISVTQGIVSVDNEYITLDIDGTARQYRSIRIDTPLYQGNSGGGLFNVSGELIGIANAGNGSEENINFAIPLPIVTGVADNIIHFYEDGDDSTSGLYTVDFTASSAISSQNSKYVYDSSSGSGRIVEEAVLGAVRGIAEELGLETGDIIQSFVLTRDGESTEYAIERTFDISDLLYTFRPGDTVYVNYKRDSQPLKSAEYTIAEGDFVSVA